MKKVYVNTEYLRNPIKIYMEDLKNNLIEIKKVMSGLKIPNNYIYKKELYEINLLITRYEKLIDEKIGLINTNIIDYNRINNIYLDKLSKLKSKY